MEIMQETFKKGVEQWNNNSKWLTAQWLTYVYCRLIYAFIQQKPEEHWKIIIFQFKNEVLKEAQALNNTTDLKI